MSGEGGEVTRVSEALVEDTLKPEKQLSEVNGNLPKENGVMGDNMTFDDAHDQLLQTVTELKFENEVLKTQLESLKTFQFEHDGPSQHTRASGPKTGLSADVKELHERIESLSRELSDEKQTRVAAEEALKHLREVYSEADAKAQELSGKLAEGQISPFLKPAPFYFLFF